MPYPSNRAAVIRPRITSSGVALLEGRDVPPLDRVLELAASRGEHVFLRAGRLCCFGIEADTAADLIRAVEVEA